MNRGDRSISKKPPKGAKTMTARERLATIRDCDGCPHFGVRGREGKIYVCILNAKNIEVREGSLSVDYVPDWCSLPDGRAVARRISAADFTEVVEDRVELDVAKVTGVIRREVIKNEHCLAGIDDLAQAIVAAFRHGEIWRVKK